MGKNSEKYHINRCMLTDQMTCAHAIDEQSDKNRLIDKETFMYKYRYRLVLILDISEFYFQNF